MKKVTLLTLVLVCGFGSIALADKSVKQELSSKSGFSHSGETPCPYRSQVGIYDNTVKKDEVKVLVKSSNNHPAIR
jgi:hypothetical protein